jgi:hypothetical protein
MSNPLRQFSPRASVSISLNDNLSLNMNAGRYFQQPSYTTLGFRDETGRLANKQNDISYIQADHLVGGIEYRRTAESRLSLEGFIKWYSKYPFSVKDSVSLASKGAEYGVYGDEEVVSTSKGKSWGAEIYYRDVLFEKINTILSYTFVRSEFEDNLKELIPSAWDNRHILNLTLSSGFGKNWNAGAKWRFVGGAPYTPYDYERSSIIEAYDARGQGYPDYQLYNTGRLADFHQLDVRIDKEYFFKNWSLTLYLDIQNVYNFKSREPDVLVQVKDSNGNPVIDSEDPTRYVLKYLPMESGTVLPTIGVIMEL